MDDARAIVRADVENALERFVEGVQATVAAHYAKVFPRLEPPEFSVDPGAKKYARVVQNDGTQRSVFCFVDLINGDILKAAGWKAPAKHARGSVLTPDYGVSQVGVYGPRYLR
jgi:hypothetical protein